MAPSNFVPIRILPDHEKKSFVEELNERFGVKDIPGVLIMRGRERLFLFSGGFDGRELKKIEERVIVERAGVYFAKIVDDKMKLSIEGVNVLKDQISKNIFEMDDKSTEDWIKGRDLNIKTGLNGFLAMKNGKDFFGIGKASENKIGNFIPKSRRLKEGG